MDGKRNVIFYCCGDTKYMHEFTMFGMDLFVQIYFQFQFVYDNEFMLKAE